MQISLLSSIFVIVLCSLTRGGSADNVGGFNMANMGNVIQKYSKQYPNLDKINLKDMMDHETRQSLGRVDGINIMTKMDTSQLKGLEISLSCRAALVQLFGPVLNITHITPAEILALLGKPVGKVLDAWGKPPERLLLGNFYWMGAYDECNAIDGMKYCSSAMLFASIPQLAGQYGMCFPKQCTAAEIDSFLPTIDAALKGILVLRPGSTVCDEPTKLGTGNYLTIALCILIILLVCIGTYTDLLSKSVRSSLKEDVPKPVANEEGVDHSNFQPENNTGGEASLRIVTPSSDLMGGSGLYSFAISFSLIRNIKAVLSTDSPKGAIGSINGIRTISMTWVILGHMYVFGAMFGKWDNASEIGTLVHRFTFMVVTNAYVSVDTFFLLSGLLVAYLTFRRMDTANGYPLYMVFMGYLHRYIRLTPSLIFLMLFFTNIFPLMITGPRAMFVKGQLEQPCQDYWWTNILYINNFWSMSTQCVGWVWYLANDMQFYLVSPIILYLMFILDRRYANHRLRYLMPGALIGVLCFVFMVITAIIVGVFNLPAVQSANIFPGNPKAANGGKFGDYVYEKPYTRVTPYLVGLYLGYILHRRVKIRFNLKAIITIVGWVVAIITALSVVYGTWKVFKDEPVFFNDAEDILYESLHRFAWAVAVAWVIYACQNKAGGLVDTFLSWKFWIPLSRLTYGAYLMHPVVIFYFYLIPETLSHYQDNLFVFHIISCTVIAYVSSFVLAVCVEYPVLNLEKKLLG